jgi:Concanavalin A-like lectin/glucanases superfamily
MVGSALRFNGKDQYIEIPASTPGVSMGEDDFSIELWIRTSDSQHTCNIVDKRDYSPLGYLIFVYLGHPALQIPNGDRDTNTFAMSANIANNRWHHVAAVVKRLPPEPSEIYVDGVKQLQPERRANAPLVNLDVAAPLWLGRHHANRNVKQDKFDFEGEIDELSFYHRALTAVEIQSIYRAGSRGKCRPAR